MVEQPADASRRQSVRSAEVGTDVLKALGRLPGGASLSRVAAQAGLPASKAHRYLRALIASGFAEQDEATGLYKLGREAVAIGLAALAALDVVDVGSRVLRDLRDRIDETCFLAVWSNRGATVVRVERALRAVTVVTQVGSVLPLTGSATGITFAAFLPEAEAAPVLAEEAGTFDKAQLSTRIEDARREGLTAVHSLLFPGVNAIAAPVFGGDGSLAAVITALGPSTGFDAALDGPVAAELRRAAGEIGAALGYSAP